MIASFRPAKLRRSGGGIGRFIGLGHKLWCKSSLWRSVVKDTLPLRIMEVENTALEDELSLQNSHFPLPWLLGKKYPLLKSKKQENIISSSLVSLGYPKTIQNYPYIWM